MYILQMLLITSSLASGLCTLLLGTQLQMGWAPHWFSAVLIYVYNFGYTLGAAVVPFIILSEVFLPEVSFACFYYKHLLRVTYPDVCLFVSSCKLNFTHSQS